MGRLLARANVFQCSKAELCLLRPAETCARAAARSGRCWGGAGGGRRFLSPFSCGTADLGAAPVSEILIPNSTAFVSF